MARLAPLVAALFFLACAGTAAAQVASGRHWLVSIDRLACEANGERLVVGARIGYLGPKGLVEAPPAELAAGAQRVAPRSLVWRNGDKDLARWLSAGGVVNLRTEEVGAVELKYDLPEGAPSLALAFGDIREFPLTRNAGGKGACERLLKPAEIKGPRAPARAAPGPATFRIYRYAYPCIAPGNTLRVIEANHPPQLPKQLLLFGRGFLPGIREVNLPAGKAAAQSYAYDGVDRPDPVEDAARKTVAADFREFLPSLVVSSEAAPKKHFAFNWGVQKSRSGNELYSIGLYEVRSCQ